MVPTLPRLLLAAALVSAVAGSGDRWSAAADRQSQRPTAGVTVVASSLATELVAGRTTGTTSPLAGSGAVTVPLALVVASVAVALALALRVDLTPTGRFGPTRRRGPPPLLSLRV